MEIRFVSSLTPEDENFFAPAVLKALGALLDQLPIAYTLRIETAGAQVFQHTHALGVKPDPPGTLEAPVRGGLRKLPLSAHATMPRLAD
jgi:hypothetical protein